ncbi:Gfo/Idh/MocA family oxidoreductase [Candidatus Bathyarchaeota archaeon]|nr:Gfo/Idh/MocA family oxidoreductase [Candidatus Bathyarchaeota archaeon]
MKRIKAAVIGSGLIAQSRHIPALLRMKREVDLVAVCDKNEELAKKTAAQFGIGKAYSDTSDLFSKEKLDLVDICVPPQVHADVAVESAQHGCHVMMEKPMALKTSDCDRMLDASKQQGTKICVIHNTLFHAPLLKAKALLADGAIGDFVGMRVFLSTPRWDMIDLEKHWYHKLPGGVIGETGPHVAYMTLAFAGDVQGVEVFAQNRLGHPWAPYDEFRIEMDCEKGSSSATLSYTRNCWAANVDIYGTEEALHVDLNQMSLIRHKLRSLSYIPVSKLSLSIIAQTSRGFASNVGKVMIGRQMLGTDVIISRFVESVVSGKSVPVSGEDGRDAVRTMEMIVKKYREKYKLQ